MRQWPRVLVLSLLGFFLLLPLGGCWAANTHGTPDTLGEMRAWFGDHTPRAYIHSGCLPVVPASSLTLGAFPCQGYVSATTGELVFVKQTSNAVGPLTGGTGTYWLALHRDTSTAVSSWTRQPGTGYLWQMSATQPADPANGVLIAQVAVSGGAITTVTDLRIPSSYARSGVYDITDPLYGAVGDGVLDSYAGIQGALNAAQAAVRGKRQRIFVPCGVYRINTELVITQPSYIALEAASRQCAFVFHRGSGTNGALMVDGTSTLINVSSVRRNTANASMTISHIALGSTSGPALTVKNAGRVKVIDVALFSAGTGGGNTYLLLDGGEDIHVEDTYLDLGNDSFPPEWDGILQGNITNPAHNAVVTSTVSGGRYTLVDEIYFLNCRTDGQTDGGPVFVANFGYGTLDFNPHIYIHAGKYTQAKTGDTAVPIFEWTSVQITMVETQMECITGGCPGAKIHNNGAFAGLYELIGANGTNSSATLYFVGDGAQHNLIKLIGGNYRTIKNDDTSIGALLMTGVTLSSHPEGAVTNYLDPPNAMIFGNHVLTFPGGATVLEPLFTMFRSAGGINAGAVGAGNGSQFVASRTAWSDTPDGVFEETVKARGLPSAASSTWNAHINDNIHSHFFRAWAGGNKINAAVVYVDAINLVGSNFEGIWTFSVYDTTGVERKTFQVGKDKVHVRCTALASLTATPTLGDQACCSDCNAGTSPCTAAGGGAMAQAAYDGGSASIKWRCP